MLTKLGICLYCLLRILERLGQCRKLRVGVCTIIVPARVRRVALDRLGIGFDGPGKVTALKTNGSVE